ncbi:MAG: exodeoxyribonuclease VII large subunit [Gammaproteobacteria bacterium]|nr:exodeoxyribonuclease VII large subunit [Gammaproteobacteria bacterium]
MTAEPQVYAVSELTELLRVLLEDSLPNVRVQGEISNFSRPASGHWYFTLKDQHAQIRCAMFRGSNYYVRPQPKDGDQVLARGRISLYPARGELQLICEHLEPAGAGALLAAFERLKQKLAAEGLFDERYKRALPAMPRHIGLITSDSGAAVHDVLTTLARRWPLATVTLCPVPVQGVRATAAICRALIELPQRAPAELVLLVRGGGSLEDLRAFNEENVARAIRACAVPVVTGIGHEIDVTIADFAADLRAATPTAAAERVAPDAAELRLRLDQLQVRLEARSRTHLTVQTERIQRLSIRLSAQHPRRRLQLRAQRLDELELRLRRSGRRKTADCRERLLAAARRLRTASPAAQLAHTRLSIERHQTMLATRLHLLLQQQRGRLARAEALLGSLSPQAVLGRGYALVRDAEGRLLRGVSGLRRGDAIAVELAHGGLDARIEHVRADSPPAQKP